MVFCIQVDKVDGVDTRLFYKRPVMNKSAQPMNFSHPIK